MGEFKDGDDEPCSGAGWEKWLQNGHKGHKVDGGEMISPSNVTEL